ncbi:MAG: hypothetical protein IJQ65_05525, partial [Kiritimatiellae bacterium]|nr:hypothetical protein [Kiritimatiellia bacterium]
FVMIPDTSSTVCSVPSNGNTMSPRYASTRIGSGAAIRQNDAWFSPRASCPKMFWHASPGPIDAFSAAHENEQM